MLPNEHSDVDRYVLMSSNIPAKILCSTTKKLKPTAIQSDKGYDTDMHKYSGTQKRNSYSIWVCGQSVCLEELKSWKNIMQSFPNNQENSEQKVRQFPGEENRHSMSWGGKWMAKDPSPHHLDVRIISTCFPCIIIRHIFPCLLKLRDILD